METTHNIADAGLYTDFGGLQKLRTKAAGHEGAGASGEATKEVAKQFESLFLQMMLKSMRDAIPKDDSADSDQTRFYQDMFDKQIALDLANSDNGGGLGIAEMLERDMSSDQQPVQDVKAVADDYALISKQINRSTSLYEQNRTGSDKE
jgi:flagellar protein FlgJ